jgi:LacI family transcriptional regulator
VRDAGIAGLLCPTGPGEAFGTELLEAGIPVVWLNPYSDDDHGAADASIGIDNRAGTGQLARRLLERGCATLAVLGGPDSALPADGAPDRVGPRYQPLLEAYGDRLTSIHTTGWNALAGQQAMQQLLASGERPDAVFASSDHLAAGAISACVRAGLRVPDDIAISGFGNADIGAVLMPSLTTVTWPLAELAQAGVRELVRAIDSAADDPVRETIPTELILRESA